MIFLYCIGLLLLGGLTGFILCLLLDDLKNTRKMEQMGEVVPFDMPKPIVMSDSLKRYEFKCRLQRTQLECLEKDDSGYIVGSQIMAQMRKVLCDNLVSEYDPRTMETEFRVSVWFRK